MDTRNQDWRNRDELRDQKNNEEDLRNMSGADGVNRQSSEADSENEEPYIGADKDVSGRNIVDENRDERAHHQQFGNRKYESYRNHSSADDQPMTDSGPGTV